MRTIWHEPAAAAAFDAARERWDGADAVWRAMEWTLIRDPIAGVALSENQGTCARIYTRGHNRTIGPR